MFTYKLHLNTWGLSEFSKVINTRKYRAVNGRRGGLMVSALNSRASAPGALMAGDTVLCFGQDTLLSRCLSPPRCINGYRQTLCCDGLASHPGGSRNIPSRFMLLKSG